MTIEGVEDSYLRALVFLLLRLSRRTRFFLHFALMVQQLGDSSEDVVSEIIRVQQCCWMIGLCSMAYLMGVTRAQRKHLLVVEMRC